MDRSPPGPSEATAAPSVLSALRKRRGRVTVGDVVADTGLGRDQVEASLKELLEGRRGHLAVGESGALVYSFDPGFITRDRDPLLARIGRSVKAFLTQAFKVWTVLMLVVYFVVFVALIIAALVASQSRGGGRIGGRRGRVRLPSFWIWYMFWTPNWRWGRPYYGHRWERRYGRAGDKPSVPFIKKVFAFVFGPDRPKPTRAQRDRSIIRLIRARRGVLTAAELVQHTGLPLTEAEEEMARLMASYDGDVKVTEDGVIAYVFPELMMSAEGGVRETEPDPAWRRLEPKESVTGNQTTSDLLIGGINAFNLVAAATAPFFIFPRLGLGGGLAWIGLVWIPLAFSTLFFGIPLVRSLGVGVRNGRRAFRNLRKVLLGPVMEASLGKKVGGTITVAGAVERARAALTRGFDPGRALGSGRPSLSVRESEAIPLPEAEVNAAAVEARLQEFLAEFDGEVTEGPDGALAYRFPEISRQFRGAELMRESLALEAQRVGEIVYASDDTVEEADDREARAFDLELERGRDLQRYLQAPDRLAVLDDFELVAFEEGLAEREAKAGAQSKRRKAWR